MLRDYLSAAQDQLENKQEMYEIKQQRLQIAQEEYNHLNKLAASRSSLCSSSSSMSRHDPELLRADLAMAKERVRLLKQELKHITHDITFTQRGMNTLHSVGEKINARQNGCYDIAEVQAIREEMLKVHKSLVSGEKVREELMRSLVQIKNELSRQQINDENAELMNAASPFDRVCVASQTDLCGAGDTNSGARFAEMAKTKLQYSEWRKHIKKLQQQLADHVERIDPGQLESDKDRILLIQEKEKFLNDLNSISMESRTPEEVRVIRQTRQKLEDDLNEAYEATNQCIAKRLRFHEEKQFLVGELQEALKSTKKLEERLKSFSSESTFSISSGSSLGSLSTASSKSALSFTDIYIDPFAVDSQIDVIDLQRRSQRFYQQQQLQAAQAQLQLQQQQQHQQQQQQAQGHPQLQQQPSSELSLSPRSSLSMETPPASPMKYSVTSVDQVPPTPNQRLKEEPTYANTSGGGAGLPPLYQPSPALAAAMARTHAHDLDSTLLDCMVLEAKLQKLNISAPLNLPVAPLSPISEKPSLLDLPQEMLSRSSSSSNTRSVSAAVSNESVAGDSGVFEASRVHLPRKELAQVQIGLKYLKEKGVLVVSLERANNLLALWTATANNSQVYLRAALLPNSLTSIRTKAMSDFQKPVFSDTFAVPISLSKLQTKSLHVTVVSMTGQKEEIIGTVQISMAEFNPDDSTLKWYNVLSSKFMPTFEPLDIPSTSAAAAAATSATPVTPAASANAPPSTASSNNNAPNACKEESSDESTYTSSQTSTLTRNQVPPFDVQAQITEEMQEQLSVNDEDDEDDDDEDDDDEDELAGLSDDFTKKMLEAYNCIDLIKQEYADKETNTECAFPPEKSRASQQQQQQQQQMADDRPVKRSQTFTPSAAVNKNRYICRLNRSDSDSAMHFGVTPHPFHRGAVERRSLRFHTKATKQVTKLRHTHIPRTSLDLELDLQAQHSKLDFLNDQIAKLQNLKEVLEKGRDNRDPLIAAWAIENEEFQRLVERADPAKCPEEKQLHKLLMKTAKEIYKLRKTKVPKGSPDLLSFKEKMTFFTRKGFPVPDLPDRADYVLSDADLIEEEDEDDEEEEARETAIAINTALVASNNRNKNLNENHVGGAVSRRELNAAKSTAAAAAAAAAAATVAPTTVNTTTPAEPTASTSAAAKSAAASNKDAESEQNDQRFEYVVDRNYGVEV
ncbi:protein kibra isoform X2 [Eurosta solidaginis]